MDVVSCNYRVTTSAVIASRYHAERKDSHIVGCNRHENKPALPVKKAKSGMDYFNFVVLFSAGGSEGHSCQLTVTLSLRLWIPSKMDLIVCSHTSVRMNCRYSGEVC